MNSPDQLQFSTEAQARDADRDVVINGLLRFNADVIDEQRYLPFAVFVRGGDGVRLGGYFGFVIWRWPCVEALPFYEALGDRVFGVHEDYPPGYQKFHLAKRFSG